MKKKIVAIGDLHGHYEQMMQLLERIQQAGVDFETDTLVFLGDYVDGGPETKNVLDELMILKEEFPHFKFLFGNHESLMLDAFNPKHPIYGDYYLWYNQGGKETADSYKPRQSLTHPDEWEQYQRAIMQPKDFIPEKHFEFIRGLDLYYETDDYFFVHGGIYPNRSISEHIKSVQKDYPVGFHPDLMKEGDMAYDMIWMREPFIDSDYDWGKEIIFGHTTWPYYPHKGTDPDSGELINRPGYPLIMQNKVGLDTMRHNDGRLTALILPERKFIFSDFTREDA